MDRQLIEATQNGDVNEVRDLLAAGANPSAFGNAPIQWAAQYGHLEVIRLLLSDPRVDPSVEDNYAIQMAAQYDYLEVVRLLLSDQRVDPTNLDNAPIRYASANGHLEVVQLLLADPRVDPSADNNYAIRWAAMNNHPEVVQFLATVPGILTATVDYYLALDLWKALQRLARMTGCLSESDEDLMVWGAAVGSVNLVRTLVDRGVDPTFDNNLALEAAQYYGQQNVIDYLLTYVMQP